MPVTVLSTGGTIAATPSTDTDAEPSLTATDLVDAVPELETVADIRTEEFANIPSPHLTIEATDNLVERLHTLDADPAVDGVVVTQGTDVLEETAYFAALVYSGATPVAFTGAMRNPSLPSPDGPANLLASTRVVTDPNTPEPVLVVFNDRVHDPRTVTKTNTQNVDTFRSPEFGPLGIVEEDRVTWRRTPTDLDPVLDPDPDGLTNDVPAVTATIDMPPTQIPTESDLPALCLAATGAGHIPPTIIPRLETVREADVPIVVTSRCPEGRLARTTYGFEGSETTLQTLGCYYSDLNLAKTRIKTIVGLAADGLDTVFDQP